MYLKQLFAFITAIVILSSCDDNTSTLGMDMVPVSDLVTNTYKTYDVATSSYTVGDSVLARTSTSYFGQFSDPLTGTSVKSDFLCQFKNTISDFHKELVGDTAIQVNAVLYIKDFVGDSLAPLKLEVYELDSLLDANADYYTNIDPSKFVKKDAKPIGSLSFSASNRTITDSARYTSMIDKNIYALVPLDKEIGNNIIQGLAKDPSIATDPTKWFNSGLRGSKGFYYKLCGGDGAMMYISATQFNVYYRFHDTKEDKDSISILKFEGTEEVIQASRFETTNVSQLAEDTNVTYLKCPAGIFTMAEFPLDSISANDTINSASIKFTRYNDDAEMLEKVDNSYRLGIPQNVLMVRYDDYINGFFENYQLADGITSYTTSFNKKNNTYEFKDISRLITTMLQEKKNGKASENFNKVLIIPIDVTVSNSSIVKINHDFSMKSARLVKGEKKDGGVKIEVVYSKFIR